VSPNITLGINFDCGGQAVAKPHRSPMWRSSSSISGQTGNFRHGAQIAETLEVDA
jgi:hypothetical protein